MEKEYSLSRWCIVLLTIVTSFIALINEDISIRILGIIVSTTIAFFVSLLGERISRRMIERGDKFTNDIKRVLYYFGLLVLILVIFLVFWLVSSFINSLSPVSDNLSKALSKAFVFVLFEASFFVFLIIPYIQTLIVLLIRRIIKK